jgi:uncharacterized protein
MTPENIFESGMKQYEVGNYEAAFDLIHRAAIDGNRDAMTQLAIMLDAGQGVEQDVEKSIEWDLKAIASGSTTSLINLGITYRKLGDIKASKYWLEKAFASGDGEAALELARLYSVSEKEGQTVKNYLHAALQNKYISDDSKNAAARMLSELALQHGY